MAQIIRAAVVQLCSQQDLHRNLERVRQLVQEAVERGAELVTIPENFCFIGDMDKKLALAEPLRDSDQGPILGTMSKLAHRHRIHLLLGGMPTPSTDPRRFHNTAVLLGARGQILASYHKIHLFDVNIPDGAVFRESEHVLAGNTVVTVPFAGTRIGLSICYDIRFPELYRRMAEQGATVCCVPAAFTLHTGKDHWLPLLRARAIENQMYVLAPAQHGRHGATRVSFGKSCIVDPWGAVIAQAADRDTVAVADLDLNYLAKVRRELPCLDHRRL